MNSFSCLGRSLLVFVWATLVWAASAAQAANYVSVSGAHTTFFYDADFFTGTTVSVDGDDIRFSFDPGVLTAAVNSPSDHDKRSLNVFLMESAALLVVANPGYVLEGDVGRQLVSSVTRSTGRASGDTLFANWLTTGTYASNLFSADGSPTTTLYGDFSQLGLGDPVGTTSYVTNTSTDTGHDSVYQAMRFDVSLGASVQQTGAGASRFGLSSVGYDFTAIEGEVPPVPEPQVYLMLLAGLALLAGRARRAPVRRLLRSLPALLALACGAGAVQAANYVELHGADVDFFIDADYFNPAAATVSGNSISFVFSPDRYTASATGLNAAASVNATFDSQDVSALYVVAHNGMVLRNLFDSHASGAYLLTGYNGWANSTVWSRGVIADNLSQILDTKHYYSSMSTASLSAPHYPGSGSVDFVSNRDGNALLTGDVLGIDLQLGATVQAEGASTSALSILTLGYSFVVLTAVPEPQAWRMLLAGAVLLALVSWVRRARSPRRARLS